MVVPTNENATEVDAALNAAREALGALAERHPGAVLEVLQAASEALAAGEALPPDPSEAELQHYAARVALPTVLPRVSRDALLLLALPHMEFTEDFLNRVRTLYIFISYFTSVRIMCGSQTSFSTLLIETIMESYVDSNGRHH